MKKDPHPYLSKGYYELLSEHEEQQKLNESQIQSPNFNESSIYCADPGNTGRSETDLVPLSGGSQGQEPQFEMEEQEEDNNNGEKMQSQRSEVE